MQTIFVSRGSYRRGRELAERLADCLGCRCVSREDVIEAATQHGIPVGKLEEAVVKRRPLTEALGLLAERYKAFVTMTLCERVLEAPLVYHGRAGHLVLPGVQHILRVRALTDVEDRYDGVVDRLHLSREKAKEYVSQVDDDIRRWIRTMYDLDINDPSLFNLTVNCSKLTVANIATALVSMAQLPEFTATPAGERRLENLLLAARCRLVLADDPRTRDLNAQVRAEIGSVSVTYPPRQSTIAEAVGEVLSEVAEIRQLRCTVAASTILWVQERFDPESATMASLLDLAGRWDAAIDVVRLLPEADGAEAVDPVVAEAAPSLSGGDGGILDDAGVMASESDDGGVRQTVHRLIQAGRAGAQCSVCGGQQSLIGSLCNVANVSLVVVDELFLSRGEAIRKRLTRDLASRLGERLRVPVIGAEELKTRYLFGAKQWLQLLATGGLTALLYLVTFTHQEELLAFLRSEGTMERALAVTVVTLTAPLIAYLWGTAAHNLLRLARFE